VVAFFAGGWYQFTPWLKQSYLYKYHSDNVYKAKMLSYFDINIENLEQIEGIWSLNVIRTLTYNGQIIGKETEEIRSEWAVIRSSKLSFKVCDIGKAENEKGAKDFEAYFEKTAIEGFYTYKCQYYNPNWIGKSNVELTSGVILDYSFYVDDVYMKDRYKSNYRPGLKLHWHFIWTKKYPQKNTSSTSEFSKVQKGDWAGNGTGFFIDTRGYIATNYHVIENASEIEVEYYQNGIKKIYKVKVITNDKKNDLSILKINNNSFKPFANIPYNFKTEMSDVGTSIFTLGYPMALSIMGEEIKFTDGKISSKTGFQGDITTYQISVPVQPGNSGGPLFDYDGNLIGLVNAKIMAADNVAYVIKLPYLKNLIDVLPENLILPSDKTLINRPLTEKIKVLSDYIVMIKIK